VIQYERVLVRLQSDLVQIRARWALIGGLAVSIRSEPRTTFDIDIVVSVESDPEAERVVRALCERGYSVLRLLEQEATGRLAGARLAPAPEAGDAPIRILFASSGIEDTIVGESELVKALGDLVLPVAAAGHLIALKVLACQADRPQGKIDAMGLLAGASLSERERARIALDRIERRGFDRGKNLQRELAELIGEVERSSRSIDP